MSKTPEHESRLPIIYQVFRGVPGACVGGPNRRRRSLSLSLSHQCSPIPSVSRWEKHARCYGKPFTDDNVSHGNRTQINDDEIQDQEPTSTTAAAN
ncbi:unnamed protein product [Ectocarpus sp. 6 AP-2014]